MSKFERKEGSHLLICFCKKLPLVRNPWRHSTFILFSCPLLLLSISRFLSPPSEKSPTPQERKGWWDFLIGRSEVPTTSLFVQAVRMHAILNYHQVGASLPHPPQVAWSGRTEAYPGLARLKPTRLVNWAAPGRVFFVTC